jgi:aromatic-L-amino-acid decarboxylase
VGLGSDCVRRIPTDGRSRMDVAALRAAFARDAEAGVRPLAVLVTAGTVAAGAIDPLDAIADVCGETGAWLHVDGAYGAIAAMVDALRPAFRGIARADSVVFDPHKWLYTPHSELAVREGRALDAALRPELLAADAAAR